AGEGVVRAQEHLALADPGELELALRARGRHLAVVRPDIHAGDRLGLVLHGAGDRVALAHLDVLLGLLALLDRDGLARLGVLGLVVDHGHRVLAAHGAGDRVLALLARGSAADPRAVAVGRPHGRPREHLAVRALDRAVDLRALRGCLERAGLRGLLRAHRDGLRGLVRPADDDAVRAGGDLLLDLDGLLLGGRDMEGVLGLRVVQPDRVADLEVLDRRGDRALLGRLDLDRLGLLRRALLRGRGDRAVRVLVARPHRDLAGRQAPKLVVALCVRRRAREARARVVARRDVRALDRPVLRVDNLAADRRARDRLDVRGHGLARGDLDERRVRGTHGATGVGLEELCGAAQEVVAPLAAVRARREADRVLARGVGHGRTGELAVRLVGVDDRAVHGLVRVGHRAGDPLDVVDGGRGGRGQSPEPHDERGDEPRDTELAHLHAVPPELSVCGEAAPGTVARCGI